MKQTCEKLILLSRQSSIVENKITKRDMLKRHILTNHGGQKQYICDMCDKTFFTSAELNQQVPW